MAKSEAKFGPIFAKFASMPIEEVAKDPQRPVVDLPHVASEDLVRCARTRRRSQYMWSMKRFKKRPPGEERWY